MNSVLKNQCRLTTRIQFYCFFFFFSPHFGTQSTWLMVTRVTDVQQPVMTAKFQGYRSDTFFVTFTFSSNFFDIEVSRKSHLFHPAMVIQSATVKMRFIFSRCKCACINLLLYKLTFVHIFAVSLVEVETLKLLTDKLDNGVQPMQYHSWRTAFCNNALGFLKNESLFSRV